MSINLNSNNSVVCRYLKSKACKVPNLISDFNGDALLNTWSLNNFEIKTNYSGYKAYRSWYSSATPSGGNKISILKQRLEPFKNNGGVGTGPCIIGGHKYYLSFYNWTENGNRIDPLPYISYLTNSDSEIFHFTIDNYIISKGIKNTEENNWTFTSILFEVKSYGYPTSEDTAPFLCFQYSNNLENVALSRIILIDLTEAGLDDLSREYLDSSILEHEGYVNLGTIANTKATPEIWEIENGSNIEVIDNRFWENSKYIGCPKTYLFKTDLGDGSPKLTTNTLFQIPSYYDPLYAQVNWGTLESDWIEELGDPNSATFITNWGVSINTDPIFENRQKKLIIPEAPQAILEKAKLLTWREENREALTYKIGYIYFQLNQNIKNNETIYAWEPLMVDVAQFVNQFNDLTGQNINIEKFDRNLLDYLCRGRDASIIHIANPNSPITFDISNRITVNWVNLNSKTEIPNNFKMNTNYTIDCNKFTELDDNHQFLCL